MQICPSPPSLLLHVGVEDRNVAGSKLDFHGSCPGNSGDKWPLYEQLRCFLNGSAMAPAALWS